MGNSIAIIAVLAVTMLSNALINSYHRNKEFQILSDKIDSITICQEVNNG